MPEENEPVDPRGVFNLDLVLLPSEGRERLAGVAGVIGVMGDDGERERGLPESTLAVSDLADSLVESVGTTGTKVRCCWRSGWTRGWLVDMVRERKGTNRIGHTTTATPGDAEGLAVEDNTVEGLNSTGGFELAGE